MGDLEFHQEQPTGVPVQDRVELLGHAGDVDVALDRVALTQITEVRARVRDDRGLVGTDQAGEVVSENSVDGAVEQFGDVRADVAHREVMFVDDREHAAGLDAARDVDRLAGAIVQVDRRAGRNEVLD